MNLATRVSAFVALASLAASMPALADKAGTATKGDTSKQAAKTEAAKQPAATGAGQQASTDAKGQETKIPVVPKSKSAKKGLTLGKSK